MNEELKKNESTNDFVPEIKKGKGKKVLIIVILLLIAGGIGLFFGYKRLTTNPLSIYKRAINETYELASKFLEENYKDSMDINLMEDALNVNTTFTLDTNMEELSVLKNYEYSLSIGTDVSNEQLNIALGLKEDKENIINLLFLFLEDNMYLKSDELYKETLALGEAPLDFSELDASNSYFSYDDLDLILSKTKTLLINSLDNNKFSTAEKTINVNDKDVKAKEFTYTLDKENMERTINYLKKEMVKDNDLMGAISRIMGITTSELKEMLEEEVNYSDYENIYINLYTDGGVKVIAGNVFVQEEEVIKFSNLDNLFTMTMGTDETIIDIESKDDVTTITLNEDGKEMAVMTITIKNDKEVLEFEYDDGTDAISLAIETSNTKNTKTSASTDYKVNASINSNGEEISFEIAGNLEITKEKLETVNTSTAVDIDNMSNEELQVFYENFMSIIEKLNLTDYLEL